MIYLASQSKRRKELLKQARIPFRIVPSDFKEHAIPGNPVFTVMTNALGKAAYARVNAKKGIILGADTVVYSKKKILGKPKHKEEAVRMLFSLAGTEHSVYTGVALFNLESKSWKQFYVESKVRMKKLSRENVKHYISKVNPLDKAGAYAIQEHGDRLIQRIKGSYTNVIGLPMEALKKALKEILK